MPSFTLRVFEQIGSEKSQELRFLGQRQLTAATMVEGKRWLSGMIAEGRLESDRFYQLESMDSCDAMQREVILNIAFYLFPDRKLCPVRIWRLHERTQRHNSEPEWSADFEGIPGWSLIASMVPRWHCLRTVPVERSWLGRSKRDWQRRDCYVLDRPAKEVSIRAA